MGPPYPDMDSISGCLGIRRIAKMHGKTLLDCPQIQSNIRMISRN